VSASPARHTAGALTIEILEGDISLQDADAVVNAANTALWMGSGVAGALKRRGGETIEREAMAKGPIEPGDAVLTSGGALAARHVIHAAVMGQDLATSEAYIRDATARCLEIAREHGLRSIAFPALGTGVGGFPLDRCAEIMIDAIRAHAGTATSLATVRLVLFGREAHDAFAAVAARALS
jgi:O-acetyl-ADP-ribose deacetylase (regulator of RNase III)